MSNKGKYWFFMFFMLPVMVYGQVTDTAAELKKLAGEFKSYTRMGCDYVKIAQFPNNDKDQISGSMYVNNEQHYYYNDCDAFLMIVSDHWFYNADHRKKILTIIDLSKKSNKQVKESVEKNFFNNSMMNTFLDSVLQKKAIIKKIKQQDTLLTVNLTFPKSEITRQLDMVYNWQAHILVSYDMTTFQAMQKSDKGITGVTAIIHCNNFKKSVEETDYEQSRFFSCDEGKLKVKKYNNYKLSTKM